MEKQNTSTTPTPVSPATFDGLNIEKMTEDFTRVNYSGTPYLDAVQALGTLDSAANFAKDDRTSKFFRALYKCLVNQPKP